MVNFGFKLISVFSVWTNFGSKKEKIKKNSSILDSVLVDSVGFSTLEIKVFPKLKK